MSVTHSVTLDRRHDPFIGEYRRSADCGPRRGERVVAGRAPNYTVRRAVAAIGVFVVAVLAFVALSSLLAGLGGDPAAAAETSPAGVTAMAPSAAVPTVHVAAPGDTLWSIAQQYRGDVDHQRYVDALVRLNDGASIQAGQAVRLP